MMVNCGPPEGAAAKSVSVGDYVVCFGEGGPSLKEAAGLLSTAQSDLTCDLTRRVERLYVNLPEPGGQRPFTPTMPSNDRAQRKNRRQSMRMPNPESRGQSK